MSMEPVLSFAFRFYMGSEPVSPESEKTAFLLKINNEIQQPFHLYQQWTISIPWTNRFHFDKVLDWSAK